MRDPFLTTLEAAQRLGIAPDTLRSWARAGRIRPSIMTSSGMRLYRLSLIEKLVMQRAANEQEARSGF